MECDWVVSEGFVAGGCAGVTPDSALEEAGGESIGSAEAAWGSSNAIGCEMDTRNGAAGAAGSWGAWARKMPFIRDRAKYIQCPVGVVQFGGEKMKSGVL